MLLLGTIPALLIALLLAGAMWAWRMPDRRLHAIRRGSRRHGLEAQAALWRHPAGRGRWPEGADPVAFEAADHDGTRPLGPDDDPEFIRALARMIRGEDGGRPV